MVEYWYYRIPRSIRNASIDVIDYCSIVSEDGASTYSVSKMAESEPDVKPLAINLRSAGRRKLLFL